MKKFFKYLAITLGIIIILSLGTLFYFRNKINLCINIAKKYSTFKYDKTFLEPMSSMTHKDIIYKETNKKPQTLDIYEAKKKLSKGSPVLLYVHGGSWLYGNKDIPKAISPLLESFRDEGFTIVSTSYELMKDKEIFSKQISDVKDTIRWIYKNKEKYNFNTDEIGIIGTSAGAQLSLVASYSDDFQFTDDSNLAKFPSKVKYIIDFCGPTNLKTLNLVSANSDIRSLVHSVKDKNLTLDKYSPISYLKKDLPKTLIIHSKLDKIVPYENATILYEKSKALGNKVELLSLDKSGHDFSNINKDDVTQLGVKILKFIILNSSI